ncbi:MAG: ATP-binding cassette, subfamily bacterial CvaB/MchF/RaxB [Sphingomonadales bacterium]|nr:ATP-binding cassette, subfamily bacterial CvaB/MchF/RaxB [Sphingomonadales bacterium]
MLSSRRSASIPSILEPQTLAVLQEDSPFAGSLANNIALFEDSPDVERIHLSAAAAAVHNDIVQVPMGYGPLVGDMESTLSGGQKRRVLPRAGTFAGGKASSKLPSSAGPTKQRSTV